MIGTAESIKNAQSSAILVGNMDVTSKGDILNQGTIESKDLLLLESLNGDILNQARLGIDGQGNDILLSQATIKSGGAMKLAANTITNDGSSFDSGVICFLRQLRM